MAVGLVMVIVMKLNAKLLSSLISRGLCLVVVSTNATIVGAADRPKPTDFYIKANAALNEARESYKKRDYAKTEALLKPLLAEVRKNEPGKAIFGKYLGLLAASSYFEKKYKDCIAYAEEALKVDQTLLPDEKLSDNAVFGNHSYAGLSYKELEKLPEATKHLEAAIATADKAGKESINQPWLNICYDQLITAQRRQGKYEEAKKTKEHMVKAGFK